MTGPIEAPTTCLSIDLDALVRNWQALNARAGTAECAGIVKTANETIATNIAIGTQSPPTPSRTTYFARIVVILNSAK